MRPGAVQVDHLHVGACGHGAEVDALNTEAHILPYIKLQLPVVAVPSPHSRVLVKNMCLLQDNTPQPCLLAKKPSSSTTRTLLHVPLVRRPN